MIKKHAVFSLAFLLVILYARGQNYIEYQKTYNRIDEDIFNGDYSVALGGLDSIYENYDFIYARHCFKSLQICCAINDSIRAAQWLEKCFKQGIPLWIVNHNELTAESLCYSTTQHIIVRYDALHEQYKSSINLKLAKQLDSLSTIMQKRVNRINYGFFPFRPIFAIQWKKNTERSFEMINHITDEYGFPGERLIGLPTSLEDYGERSRPFYYYGPMLSDYRAYNILINYYGNPRKDINEKLYQNMLVGNIPAPHFGAINDFMAQWGKGKFGDYQFYSVWFKNLDKANINEVNERRNAIGLTTFENQERNFKTELGRRGKREANSEIIME